MITSTRPSRLKVAKDLQRPIRDGIKCHCLTCDYVYKVFVGHSAVFLCNAPVLREKGTIDTVITTNILAKCKLLGARPPLFHSRPKDRIKKIKIAFKG